MITAAPPTGRRGHALLLAHCSAVSRLEETRPRAFERLEQQVGGDLARLLLNALGAPGRDRRLA
jgi:predicted secreted Zn-dependent protease